MADPAEGGPPVWVGDGLAVLTRARGDAPGVVVVDPRNGAVSAGATRADRVGSLSISGDGRVAAFAANGDGPIEIAPPGPGCAASRPIRSPRARVRRRRGSAFAWLTLDRTGAVLAVVRTDADGESTAFTVHAAGSGWAQIARIGLPAGASRAVVAWLP